jgi:hypothetical protein
VTAVLGLAWIAWTLCAVIYIVVRDRRHRAERAELIDQVHRLIQAGDEMDRAWRDAIDDRHRIYIAIGTFQRAHPQLANELSRILRTTPRHTN